MAKTGVILAFDVSEFGNRERGILTALAPHIDLVKIGLEAMTAETSDGGTVARKAREFVLQVLKKEVMWDMKLDDIENTVTKAVRNIINQGSSMLTLHATVSDGALRATASECTASDVLALAVTVLTDLDEAQCQSRFGDTPTNKVRLFARNASICGIGGLVCSPKELSFLEKHNALYGMKTVIPGIRPAWAAVGDQKRIMTPAEAAKAGADYIVVGRPILQPPNGMSALDAAQRIREELDAA